MLIFRPYDITKSIVCPCLIPTESGSENSVEKEGTGNLGALYIVTVRKLEFKKLHCIQMH